MRLRWPLIGALVLVGVLVWLWRSASEPVEPTPEPVTPSTAPQVAPSPAAPSAAPKRPLYVSPRAITFDASQQHTADPCSPILEPAIPQGFEQITEGPITVAWSPTEIVGPYDAPMRPVALAHVALGFLEEAAQLTGTDRRDKLTLIIDSSADDLQQRMHAPSWVGGLYDGGAVLVPAKLSADLGVVLQTLRHEIMHAQIHSGVGCVPFWFNEGMAQYYSGRTDLHEWLAMLRTADSYELSRVGDPVVFDVNPADARRMYAVSLAMIVYLVKHGEEHALRTAVATARASDRPLELWDQVAPRIGYHDILGALAQSLFKVAPGPDLDTILRGSQCCRNLQSPAEVSCRAAVQGEVGIVGRREFCRHW